MALLTFLGAAQQVTGSCHMLETPALGRILLDCGMQQGRDNDDGEPSVQLKLAPESIDAVILSHAHIDHCGLLPLLVHEGFAGPIWCTRATARLLAVMLEDAVNLYERDIEYTNLRRARRGDKPIKAAYGMQDVVNVLKLCKPVHYHNAQELGNGATVRFHDAGHILGSAIVELRFREREVDKTLVFSGDLGKKGSVLMNDPEYLTKADVVLMEGTYGNRDHRSTDGTLEQFETILHETWHKRGNVMIPAFAVGRTQELLFHLGVLHSEGKLDDWEIYLDSPMAIAVTALYERCSELLDPADSDKFTAAYGASLKQLLPNLRYTRSQDESMAINKVKHGAIIIAGSGMCTGGRIRHHFKQRIWGERNTVIFCGFQAHGTLGRLLVDGVKKIKMFGSEFAVRARIETLGGFSAHAGQRELIDWATHFDPTPRLILVHGEADALEALSDKLWQDKRIKAEIPHEGQTLQF